MNQEELSKVAKEIATKPKGILAMDESTPTMGKRLAGVGLENTEENRRDYRESLASAPGLGQYISGAILYEETLLQKGKEGVRLSEQLQQQGIHPGIKVDKGAKENPDFPGGKITEGLDGLGERAASFAKEGAKFAKWRAVLTVANTPENSAAVEENAKRLAEYAKVCQENGLVPIVEPEVLMDGSHSIDECYEKTKEALSHLYKHMQEKGVHLPGTLLKPNMIHPGKDSGAKPSAEEVAQKTIAVLKECVPAEVPGIMFLSGGLSDDDAANFLSAMNHSGEELPWNLSFSYGRALQRAALETFAKGDPKAAQEKLLERAKACSQATLENNVTV